MNFEVISGAAAVALAGSAVFALLARFGQALTRSPAAAGNFTESILPEAAQRFREEFNVLCRKQGVFLTSGFVFTVLFLVAYLLVPANRFDALPVWQLVMTAAMLLAVAAYAAWRLMRLALARRRMAFVRDAAIVTAQGLQKLTGNMNRVFHEVPCGNSILDDVVVGLHGIYAVYVIPRRPGRHNKLRMQRDRLLFAPGKHWIPISPMTEQSDLLARQLKKALDLAVRVRTVIAVPGWEIEEQTGDNCLVVNERNLVMLRGWKDSEEYLMHEDVERLHDLLTERCIRRPYKGSRRAAS